MTEQKPSVGRIVHFKDTAKGHCLAAIVTQVCVGTGDVNLAVFPPGAHTWNVDSVSFSDGHDDNTWHWPERGDRV